VNLLGCDRLRTPAFETAMRLFGGFERKLAVDGHGELAGGVRGKKVGRAIDQLRTCGNVIRKMRSRKEHRPRLG